MKLFTWASRSHQCVLHTHWICADICQKYCVYLCSVPFLDKGVFYICSLIKCYNNDDDGYYYYYYLQTRSFCEMDVLLIFNWQFQFEGWWKCGFNCSVLAAFYFYKLISFQMGSNQLLKVLKIYSVSRGCGAHTMHRVLTDGPRLTINE